MDKLKQRIAIAEKCGWVWYRIPIRHVRSLFHPSMHEYEGQDPRWMVRADGTERIANERYMTNDGHVPDYLNDWNAMHDAVGSLPSLEKRRFLAHLEIITRKPAASHWFDMRIINATLEDYAQALLRSIGKWEE